MVNSMIALRMQAREKPEKLGLAGLIKSLPDKNSIQFPHHQAHIISAATSTHRSRIAPVYDRKMSAAGQITGIYFPFTRDNIGEKGG